MNGKILSVPLAALKHPTIEDLKRSGSLPALRQILRDESPETEGDVLFTNLLEKGEKSLKSGQIEERMKAYSGKLLGYQHAQWIVANQKSDLEFAEMWGIVYFVGLEIVLESGHRVVPFLQKVNNPPGSKNYNWGLDWATVGLFELNDDSVVAVLR